MGRTVKELNLQIVRQVVDHVSVRHPVFVLLLFKPQERQEIRRFSVVLSSSFLAIVIIDTFLRKLSDFSRLLSPGRIS